MRAAPGPGDRREAAQWRGAMALSATIALAILVLSLLPGTGAPPDDGMLDKLAHALAYAALVLPLSTARPRIAPAAAAVAVFLGGAIELLQPHVGRSGEWEDALANAVGAVAGAILGPVLRRFVIRRRSRPGGGN